MGGWVDSDDDGAIWDGPDPLGLGGDSGDSGADSEGSDETDAQHVPTGVQNPFDWEVNDGDVTAPPDSSVTQDGNVGGSETVTDDNGSLDINPLGDIEIDPADEDHTTSEDGAKQTQPNTRLTALIRQGTDPEDAVQKSNQNGQTMLLVGLVGLLAVVALTVGGRS